MRNHLDECLRSISRGVDMCQVSDGELGSGLNSSLSFEQHSQMIRGCAVF